MTFEWFGKVSERRLQNLLSGQLLIKDFKSLHSSWQVNICKNLDLSDTYRTDWAILFKKSL